jgi:hypothetical protein
MFWILIICGSLVFAGTTSLVYSQLESERQIWHKSFAGSF